MTGLMAIVGVLFGLGSVLSQAPVPAGPMLSVATPTFAADGSKFGAQAAFPLVIGKPQVIFAGAGTALCLSWSARSTAPDDVGYGWGIEVIPRELTVEGVLVMDVVWQRRWQDGRASEGAINRSQVRLADGGRVQLDYLGASVTPRCQALGMALELARPPRPASGLYEVETWLVPAVYGEAIQHQALRIRLGDTGAFHFDDLAVPEGRRRARIEGTLALVGQSAGGFESMVRLSRADSAEGGPFVSQGSVGYPLKAAFGEVVEFRVPMGSFSLRVRVRQLR